MNAAQFTAELHQRILLSRHLGIEVVEFSDQRALLKAPLAPNINHVHSVFGGSLYAVGALACYSLFRAIAGEAGPLDDNLVIQEGQIKYLSPVLGDFTVEALRPPEEGVRRFFDQLKRAGKARLTLQAEVHFETKVAAVFSGRYVLRT